MFIGEYEHSLDEKGRIAIPRRFRGQFGDELVLTKGFDKCLWAYTDEAWRIFANKIEQLPIGKADARKVSRLIFSGSVQCELDKQGRIVIPAFLREYAGIDTEAVVLGVNDRVEIWAKDIWTEVKAVVDNQGGALAEQLSSMGIL